jgi:putative transferase (TIGR04331 family)
MLCANEACCDFDADEIWFLNEDNPGFNLLAQIPEDKLKSLPCVFNKKKDFCDGYSYIKATTEKIIASLTNTLNVFHNENYTEKAIGILIRPWLSEYISTLYEKYLSIQMFLVNNKEFYSISWLNNRHIPVYDTADFYKKVSEDEYNLFLALKVIKFLGHEDRIMNVKETIIQKESNINIDEGFNLKKMVMSLYKAVWARGLDRRKILIDNPYFHYMENMKLFYKMHGELGISYSGMQMAKNEDGYIQLLRDSLAIEFDVNSKFEAMLKMFISEDIPIVFLEGFKELKNESEIFYKKCTPKFIGSTTGWEANEKFKLFAAINSQNEALLVGLQHGGNYGVEEHIGNIEYDAVDLFFSWGWSDDSRKTKIYALPATKVCGLGKLKHKKEGNILFATTNYTRYFSRFLVCAEAHVRSYFDDQFIFLKNLEDNIYSDITVRLYPYDFGRNIREMYKYEYPDIKIESNRKKFLHSLKISNLFVTDNIGTTYLEALSANIPTIIYCREEYIEFSKIGKGIFNKLEEVGIFHRTPEAAAVQVNEIYNDLENWWREPARVSIVNEFLTNFAFNPPKPLNIWEKQLKRMI